MLEALINAGVFDDLEPNRRYLLENLGGFLKLAEQTTKNQQSGQGDLFGMGSAAAIPAAMPTFAGKDRFWSPQEQLQNEKGALGLYLTGHPIDAFKDELMEMLNGQSLAVTLEKLSEMETSSPGEGKKRGFNRGKRVWVAGLVMEMRVRPLKSGNGKMAFVTIDDRSARTEVSFFSKAYDANQEVLQVDEILIIRGRASYDDFSGGMKINADYAFPLSQATEHFADALQLTLDNTAACDELVNFIKANRHSPGQGSRPLPVYFHIDGRRTAGKIKLGEHERIALTADAYTQLLELCGKDKVKLKYNLNNWQEPSKETAQV